MAQNRFVAQKRHKRKLLGLCSKKKQMSLITVQGRAPLFFWQSPSLLRVWLYATPKLNDVQRFRE
jgi:hypothetical protein